MNLRHPARWIALLLTAALILPLTASAQPADPQGTGERSRNAAPRQKRIPPALRGWSGPGRGGRGWDGLAAQAHATFAARVANPVGGLHDVVDVGHVPGTADPRLRPNQILCVGGLPFPLLEGAAARAVVDRVESALLTPLGLRSLAPDEPGYVGRYRGGPGLAEQLLTALRRGR